MIVRYKDIIKNLKQFFEENFENISLSKDFDIDNGIFSKEYRKNEFEKKQEKDSIDWLQNLDIYFCESTFSGEKIVLARYNTGKDVNKIDSYLIYMSEENVSLDVSELQEFIEKDYEVDNLNLGIFLALFKESESFPLVNRKISKYDVEDKLNIEYTDDYMNHDYNEIKSLFSKIYLFKVNEKNLFIDEDKEEKFLKIEGKEEFIYKFLGILKCRSKINQMASESYFTEECVNEYLKLFKDNIKYLPYENLYLSLCHNSSKFIFLEVYRMIEKLYPIIMSYNMRKKFEFEKWELLEVSNIIENEFKIRCKEENSLKLLFEFGETNCIIKDRMENLNTYKRNIDNTNSEFALYSWIYKIRNTSVHLSFNREKNLGVNIKLILSKNTIVTNLVPIVGELYRMIFE